MSIRGIGIDTDSEDLDGNLKTLESKLELFARFNFDNVELHLAGMNVIRGGELHEDELNKVLLD